MYLVSRYFRIVKEVPPPEMKQKLTLFVLTFLFALQQAYSFGSTTTTYSNVPVTVNDSLLVVVKDTTVSKNAKLDSIHRFITLQRKKSGIFSLKDLQTLSQAYRLLEESGQFTQLAKAQLNQLTNLKDAQSIAEGYGVLGLHYYHNNQMDSAYYYFREGFQKINELSNGQDSENLGSFLYRMAFAQERIKDYINAEKNTIETLKYYSIENKPKNLYKTLNLLAITQNGLKNFDEALEYHHKAKFALEQIEDPETRFTYRLMNLNNLGSTHLRAENYQEAEKFYSELLSNPKVKTTLPSTYGKSLAGRAYARFKRNDFTKEQILGDLNASLAVFDSLNSPYNLARTHNYMAEVHLHFGEKDKALDHALKAKHLAEVSENYDRLLQTLQFLASNNFTNESNYAKAYFELNEKLITEEREIQEKFAKIIYETEEAETKNIDLARQKRLWSIMAIAIFIFGVGAITILIQRKTNQKLRFDHQQQQTNQEIYNLMLAQKGKIEEGKKAEQKRISEEMHDSVLGQMLGIRLILSGLNERGDDQAIDQRAEMIEKLQEVEEEIRLMSHQLSDAAYRKVDNFLLSLQEMLHTYERASKIVIRMNSDDNVVWDDLEGNVKINIFRIIQELVKNSIKHAQCESILVDLSKNQTHLLICVSDDGKGFNTNKLKKGIGLKNISSRTKKINGIFNVDSEIGAGTKMIITLPFESAINKTKTQGEHANKPLQKSGSRT